MSAFENIAIKDISSGNDLIITAAGAAKVDGSGVTQPVSGTVTIVPSGTQNVNILSSVSITVTATNLDIRDLLHTQDSIRIGDGIDLANVTAAGELNVLATAQPGVDIGDVTVNNGAGAAAINIQDGGNSITVDGPLTDAQLRATPVPVSATNLDIRDLVFASDKVDVSGSSITISSSSLPSGAATAANQLTIIGHVDGLEGLLTTIDADTSNISTKIDTLAGAVSGNEMQVDVLTMPTVTVQATDLDIRDLTFATDKVDASGTVLGASTNNIGDVDVLTLPALTAGNNIIGQVKITDGTDTADVLDLANNNPLAVAILDGSGNQITTFGGGTQYTEGDTDASISGTAMLWEDTADTLRAVSAAKPLPVNIVSGSSSGTEYTEGAVDATITGTAVLMEVAADTLQPIQGTVADGLLVNLGANNDVTVTGSVTANAGTNLNTSALALEATLQSVKTAVEIIDNAIAGNEMQVDVLTMPTVTVQATDLDIRNLSQTQDSVLIYGSDDGGTTKRVIKTDAGGAIQVDLEVANVAITSLPDEGQQTMANSISVAIASNQSAIPVSGTVAVTGVSTLAEQQTQTTSLQLLDDTVYTDGAGTVTKGIAIFGQDGTNPQAIKTDAAGELQIDVLTSALPTGAATSALQTQPGVDIGDVTINNASGASAVNIQDGGNSITVDGTVSVTGVATEATLASLLTSSQLIDDSIIVLGTDTYTEAASKGQIIGAVRRDADTTLVNTTNEFGPLQMDANGRLKVEAFSGETLAVSLASTTISGTVAVTQSGTWDEVGINDSGNSITVDAPVGTPLNAQISDGTRTATVRDTGASDSLNVAIVDGSGNQITTFGGGTEYTEGAVDATITGNAMLMEVAGDTLQPVQGTVADGLLVNLGANNDVTVTGNVTANAGTNLNTSALALETTATAIKTAVEIIDNAISGSEMQVDIVAALPAGTNNIGDVDILTMPNVTLNALPAGNNNIGDVDIASIAAGNNIIGQVKLTDGTDVADILDLANSNPLTVAIVDASGDQITSFGGGTQYTEDAAAAANPIGNATILVRADTPGALVTTDGDNVAQRGTNYGAAYTQIVSSTGAFVDTFGGGSQYTEDVASDADPIGNQLIARRRDTLAAETDADGDNVAINATNKGELYVKHESVIQVADNGGSLTVDATNLDIRDLTFATDKVDASGTVLGASTNNIGDVDVLSLPSIPAGNNNIGDVDIASIAAGDNNIGNVDIVTMPAVTNGGVFAVQESGAALTALQLIDDSVVTLGTDTYTEATSKGVIIGGVRRDANTSLANTTNEYTPLQVNALGALKVGADVAVPVNVQIGNATLSAGVIDETGASAVDALAVGGGTPHDSVNSGNPILQGGHAVSGSANPTSVAAGDRTRFIANQHGIPYVIGGHPNIIVREFDFGTAAQTDLNLAAALVAADERIYIVGLEVMCDAANTVAVSVRVGFGTANVPAASATGVSGMIASHPGIAAGSGFVVGAGSGIIAVGGVGEEPRLTSSAATTGNLHVVIRYFLIDETP